MLPLLSLHALAALHGGGLRPELLALLKRHAQAQAGLSAALEPVDEQDVASVPTVVQEKKP